MMYHKLGFLIIFLSLLISCASTSNESMLIKAAGVGKTGKVNSLLARGANVNSSNELGMTSLMAASEGGHEGAAKELLKAGADLNAVNYLNKTALMFAVERGNGPIIKILIKAGAAVNMRDHLWKTALIKATVGEEIKAVEKLVKAGADPDIQDFSGKTALMYACSNGARGIIDRLLGGGADTNIRDQLANTALMYAVESGHPVIVKVLALSGADLNAANDMGETALSMASGLGRLIITKILIRLGAKVGKPDSLRRTPLMMAAINGRGDEVKRLLRGGADINGKDHLKRTPLMMAAEKGHESTVIILRRAGARVSMSDYNRMTALAYAARGGHVKIIRYLTAAGAKVDRMNRNGVTALGHASSSGYIGAINVLLKAGANVTGGKSVEKQAWYLARSEGYVRTYRMLKDIELLPQAKRARTSKKMRQIFLDAVTHGAVKSIRILVNKGVDINFRDNVSSRDYFYLSESDVKTLGELAETFGSVNANKPVRCSGSTALGLAAYAGIDSVVELLIKSGAEIDAKDSCGQTPLAIAVSNNHLNVSLMLLMHGADVSVTNRLSGASPLIIAAKKAYVENAKALSVMGGWDGVKDILGFTALHWAVIKKSPAIVTALLRHQSGIDAKDKLGLTPLHWAAIRNESALVSTLLASHADPKIKAADGRTPYGMISGEKGFEKTASLLKNTQKIKSKERAKEKLSDEKTDPLKHFISLQNLYYRKWMVELFTKEGFCSYKTIKGPRYGQRSGLGSARIECIGKEYMGTKAKKKSEMGIRLSRKDDYDKKALAACGCR